MKRYITGLIVSILLLIVITSCKTTPQKSTIKEGSKATLALKLAMTSGDGKKGEGTNGAAVAYHEGQKKWYAVFAGNTYYPLCVFEESGKNISDYIKAGYDARGFWYNPQTKMLEGNGFDEEGILTFPLDAQGFPAHYEPLFEGGTHQADPNSVGAYDDKNDEIIYYFDGEIQRFDRKTGEKVGTWTFKKELNPYDINQTTVIYTGFPKAEIGLLDYHHKKVLLFDKNQGIQTGSIQLPEDAPMKESFNFSFSHGVIWLFDIENRTWMGYKVQH